MSLLLTIFFDFPFFSYLSLSLSLWMPIPGLHALDGVTFGKMLSVFDRTISKRTCQILLEHNFHDNLTQELPVNLVEKQKEKVMNVLAQCKTFFSSKLKILSSFLFLIFFIIKNQFSRAKKSKNQ